MRSRRCPPTIANGVLRVFATLPLLLSCAVPLHAQSGSDWNDERALSLMVQARAVRQVAQGDSALTNYRADARGYVYFYLDRADTGENTLVKTDQVALEVFWKAPDSTKQRIVGLRDDKQLPTNIRYHLDHLTVVQDEFQDLIRLGDGDEVAAVVHPAARGSEAVYDFRVSDSITIQFQGDRESVQVYEIEVRPKDFTRPGMVGSVFVDRRNGAIVRMSFTFTSASYVDDYLDYIRISLDNSLWDGRYWLPYQQQVEIRREVPFFDFAAGSVIRGRYEIRGYRFNERLPPLLFFGGPVAAVPEEERRAFPFEEALYAEVDQEGLAPPPELADIRREAARIAGRQYLSGLGRYRLWAEDASAVLRSNRVEEAVLGLGFAVRPWSDARATVGIGYGFGRDRPVATTGLEWLRGDLSLIVDFDWNAYRDLGPFTAASGALNTLAWVLTDRDFLDPYFTTGGQLSVSRVTGMILGGASLSAHRIRAEAGADGRPIRTVDEGTVVEVAGFAETASRGVLNGRARATLGRMEGMSFARLDGSLSLQRAWLTRGVAIGASLHTGWSSGNAPLHHRFLLGGRGTLPGYAFREFAGSGFTFARVETSQTIRAPWLRLGAFGAVGTTWLGHDVVPSSWGTSATGLARYSAGFTASAFWDVLEFELGRGLNGGSWELQLYVTRRFWPWL